MFPFLLSVHYSVPEEGIEPPPAPVIVHQGYYLHATKSATEKAKSGELNCVNQSVDEILLIKPRYLEGLGGEGEEEWQRNPLGLLPRTSKTGSVTQECMLDIAVHFVK